MKRTACMALVLALSTVVGCSSSQLGQRLVKPDPAGTKLLTDIGGRGGRLLTLRRHDEHLTVNVMPQSTPMDAFLLRPRVEGAPVVQKGTILLLHRFNDYKDTLLGLAENLAEKGYHIVLLDLRAHGSSGGDVSTHGIRERYDVKQVVDFLLEKKKIPRPVHVYGEGLGGVVAIMYAAIDPRVKTVISLDAYRNFDFHARWMTKTIKPERQRQEALEEAARVMGHRLADASAEDAIADVTCPVMIMHTRGNPRVPELNARALYDAAREPKALRFLDVTPDVALRWEPWMAEQIDRTIEAGPDLKKLAPGSREIGPSTQPETRPAAP